mmetsp:Transcript_83576/g.132353  ORF Transcript_83576/g.132353 Transcript_83576/m.132353 type:complete len:223 (+) Transcript_83576:802-1470(+)
MEASGASFSVVILMGIGCSTYGVIFSTFTSVYAFFCPYWSSFKKGMSHHSTSGMGSFLKTLGSIFLTGCSFSSSSSFFFSSFFFCSSSFFFFSSFLSIPKAFSWTFLIIFASFFTSSPSSINLKLRRFIRPDCSLTFKVGSKKELSPMPSFLRPRIFFNLASFSRLMLTFKVLTTCGFIGTTCPSSSSSRPNSSRMSFRAFGASPAMKPPPIPWPLILAICS